MLYKVSSEQNFLMDLLVSEMTTFNIFLLYIFRVYIESRVELLSFHQEMESLSALEPRLLLDMLD